MAPFSKPLGSTTYRCDSCRNPVGRTWRERAQHVCPNLVAAHTRRDRKDPS